MRAKFSVIISALLLLLYFVPLISAQNVPQAPTFNQNLFCMLTQSNTDLGSCVAATIPIASIGILISLLLVALAYMLGNVFRMQSLRGWYLRETVKSILIIVVIFSVLLIISSVALSFVSNSTTTPAQINGNVQQAPQGIINNLQGMYTAIQDQYFTPEIGNAQNQFYLFFGLYDAIGFLKSLNLKLYLPIPIIPGWTIGTLNFGFEENLYQSSVLVGPTDDSVSFIGNAFKMILLPMLILLEVQQAILFYVIEVGLGVLIPMGIIMRAIPFLRPLGGTFIALGIGSALVYPSLILLVNIPITNYLAPVPPAATAPQTPCPKGLTQVMCKGITEATSYITNLFSSSSAIGSVGLGYSAGSSSAGALGPIGVGFAAGILSFASIYPAFNLVLSQGFINIALQFVLFIFDLIIGVVITQDIGKILGGKVSFGVGRLKLT
jgi:hypothetical protein